MCLRLGPDTPTRAAPVPEVQRRRQGALGVRVARAGPHLKDAHRAWVRFQEIGVQVAADNRERFLQALERNKQMVKARRARHARRHDVIELCRRQLNFADGLIAEEVGELWEDWMRHIDPVLADPQLLAVVYEALARRWTNSRTRGASTPAEVVLRCCCSSTCATGAMTRSSTRYANLVYRQFTRGAPSARRQDPGKLGVPWPASSSRSINACGHRAEQKSSRPPCASIPLVETDIHYPPRTLLVRVRVLRAMKQSPTPCARQAAHRAQHPPLPVQIPPCRSRTSSKSLHQCYRS